MSWTDDSRTVYKGFQVFTSLVSFGAAGWTVRYSIFSRPSAVGPGNVVYRSEATESTDRAESVRTAAREAAYHWIDRWERGPTSQHRG